MKTSTFKFALAAIGSFLLSSCGSQIPKGDVSSNSEAYRKLMAENASTALLAERKLDRPDTAEITNLILQEKFEEFEKRAKYYEEQFLKDPLYEAPLLNLYYAIDPENGFLQDKLEWPRFG